MGPFRSGVLVWPIVEVLNHKVPDPSIGAMWMGPGVGAELQWGSRRASTFTDMDVIAGLGQKSRSGSALSQSPTMFGCGLAVQGLT